MKERHIPILEGKEILKRAQKSRKVTQAVIADRTGINPSSVSYAMRSLYICAGMFADILNALNYDVLIQDRETGNIVFRLDPEANYLDDDV